MSAARSPNFFIDGVSVYTDVSSGGHYHSGGTHLLWNTTLLNNGAHTLRMTVKDTSGQTGSVELEVIVANGITPQEGWRIAKFSQAELAEVAISGNEADPETNASSAYKCLHPEGCFYLRVRS